MSFRPAARQFFERRGAPTPPLPYDAEVEYLESTGTQYIDTGVLMAKDLLSEVTFMFTDNSYPYNIPFGANGGRAWYAFGKGQGDSGTNLFLRYGVIGPLSIYYGTNGSDHVSSESREWHTAILHSSSTSGSASFDCDGLGTITGSSSTPQNVNLYMFGGNGTGGPAKCRISSVKITDTTTNTVIRDFIPVRKNGVGYMYDRANPTGGATGDGFYANAGTGAFIYGNDKS